MTRTLRRLLRCVILALTIGLGCILAHMTLGVYAGGAWLAGKVKVKE